MNSVRLTCATCGGPILEPNVRKRFCTGAHRSKAHRLPADLRAVLRRGIESLAASGTEEQWEALRAFANAATYDDWLMVAQAWQSGFEDADANVQADPD